MRTPPEMLDDFEKKHGTFNELLNKSIDLMQPEGSKMSEERKRIEFLIRKHDRLLWMNMGWEMAMQKVKRDAKIS